MKKIISLVVLLFSIRVLAAPPPASPTLQTAPAAVPKVLMMDNGAEPEMLDPGLIAGEVEGNVVVNIFEGLTEYDPKDSHPVPAVASRWEISKDGRTYTFYLRKEAKWSDGTPVTAKDFEYAWKRALSPATASRYAFILYYLKNGQAYNEGKVKDALQVGVQAVDDATLKVTLENPTPFFLSLTSFYTYRPVKKEMVEKFGDQWTRPENIVTNGPYRLQSWTPTRSIVLVKNPVYWDAMNVKIEQVHILPIEDRDTAMKKYEAGESDRLWKMTPLQVEQKRNHPHVVFSPQNMNYFYMFNTQKPPFDNPKVRMALAMAVDREMIAKFIKKGAAFPLSTLIPPGLPGYKSIYSIPYDPVKAKQLLEEAGYKYPVSFPSVEFIYNTDPRHQSVAEAVQQMWKKNLGVDVRLRNMEWKSLLQTRSGSNFQISRHGWGGDYLDPNTFLEMFKSGTSMNEGKWKNKKFDDLLTQAGREQNSTKRMEILAEAEKIFLQEAPVIPIFNETLVNLVNPKLKGYYSTLNDMHPLKFMSWAE